jgi:hypothetical protein
MGYGGAGNDTITVDDTVDRSAILLGGIGNDTLGGGGGRDIHIGGDGTDHLNARGADDILIAGTTAHDTSALALCHILDEWRRTDATYAQRIDHLMNGGGLNDPYKLNNSTVFNDFDTDVLTGSAATTGSCSAPATPWPTSPPGKSRRRFENRVTGRQGEASAKATGTRAPKNREILLLHTFDTVFVPSQAHLARSAPGEDSCPGARFPPPRMCATFEALSKRLPAR